MATNIPIIGNAAIDNPTSLLLLDACEKALVALNTAPRFKVPALDTADGKMDSYTIASLLDRAIRLAKGDV